MGLFDIIFGRENEKQKAVELRLLNDYRAVFSRFGGDIYDTAMIRTCIDTIARNAAKLSPKHIRSTDRGFETLNKTIQRLVSEQPNELDNAYSFYYKIVSQLFLYNNAYVYIARDPNGVPIGLYPVLPERTKLLEYQGNVYVEFQFGERRRYIASLRDDVILLKRFYCQNDILGEGQEAIIKAMSFRHVMQEGIVNAIKTTANLRGYLKTTKTMLKPEDVKRTRDQFVNDFVNNSDGTGIAGLDATTDFKELNLNPVTASDGQVEYINAEIKNYFGLCDEIIQSKYTEDEWNAFYESVLEPIAVQMSLEFTNKLFTLRERQFGNKIIFESNRLQYASNTTKVQIARYLNNYLTMNEIREIFNLAPLEDGSKILQDLNHINADIADDYQGGED